MRDRSSTLPYELSFRQLVKSSKLNCWGLPVPAYYSRSDLPHASSIVWRWYMSLMVLISKNIYISNKKTTSLSLTKYSNLDIMLKTKHKENVIWISKNSWSITGQIFWSFLIQYFMAKQEFYKICQLVSCDHLHWLIISWISTSDCNLQSSRQMSVMQIYFWSSCIFCES